MKHQYINNFQKSVLYYRYSDIILYFFVKFLLLNKYYVIYYIHTSF